MKISITDADLYEFVESLILEDTGRSENALIKSGLLIKEAKNVTSECASIRADICEKCSLLVQQYDEGHDAGQDIGQQDGYNERDGEVFGLNDRISDLEEEVSKLEGDVNELQKDLKETEDE